MRNILITILLIGILFSCKKDENASPKTSEYSATKQAMEMKETTETDLTKFGIKNSDLNSLGGLKVGQLAPNFAAQNNQGEMFELNEALKESDVLIVFYRAYWCPYCSKHLQALESNLLELKEKGIKVIAVSPEQAEYSNQMVEKSEVSIPVLFDEAGLIMKSYKCAFEVTDAYNAKIKGYVDQDISEINGAKENMLPIPATYLIGQDGLIKFAHYDPNYKNRSNTADILASIK